MRTGSDNIDSGLQGTVSEGNQGKNGKGRQAETERERYL